MSAPEKPPAGRDAIGRALFEASGQFESSDPLVAFLYHLMRDHVPTGVVAAALRDALAAEGTTTFTNGHLARYAEWVASQLKKGS